MITLAPHPTSIAISGRAGSAPSVGAPPLPSLVMGITGTQETFSDAAGTLAAVPGDAVVLLRDAAGVALRPGASATGPVLMADAGLGYLRFDGGSDEVHVDLPGGSLPTQATVGLLVRTVSGEGMILSDRASGSNQYALFLKDGDASNYWTRGSDPADIRVDGVAQAGPTRDSLQAVICDGQWHMVTLSLDMSAWQGFGISNWRSGLDFAGDIAAAFVLQGRDAARTAEAEARLAYLRGLAA